jgi:DNA-binding CsgD family transcriptional regulator
VHDLGHLTDRQREIVHWASLGLSNKQIGRRLGISPETVKSHRHQVFEREGISGRVALLALHRPETNARVEESVKVN